MNDDDWKKYASMPWVFFPWAIVERYGNAASKAMIAGSCLWIGSVTYMWVDQLSHQKPDTARIIAEAIEKNRAEQTRRIAEAIENSGQSNSRFTSMRKSDSGGDRRLN